MIQDLARRLPLALPGPELLLVLYMRALALVFLVNGLAHWLELLQLPATDPRGALLSLPFADRLQTIAYAVLDPIAAVGLWLTASWGIVLWLVAALSRLVLASGLAGGAEPSFAALGLHVATIAIYLALAAAARQAAAERE